MRRPWLVILLVFGGLLFVALSCLAPPAPQSGQTRDITPLPTGLWFYDYDAWSSAGGDCASAVGIIETVAPNRTSVPEAQRIIDTMLCNTYTNQNASCDVSVTAHGNRVVPGQTYFNFITWDTDIVIWPTVTAAGACANPVYASFVRLDVVHTGAYLVEAQRDAEFFIAGFNTTGCLDPLEYSAADMSISCTLLGTFTPTPTATSTPTNTPTPTDTPIVGVTHTHTPTPSRTPDATQTVVAGATQTVVAGWTATPTPSRTPNATQTAAVHKTQTVVAGWTVTPTPDSCLQLNEVCPNPNTDHDGNGAIDEKDRALEIYNCSTTTNLWLTNYLLSTDAYSVILPASKVVVDSYKVLYGSDLQLTLPSTGTLTLTSPWGTLIDTLPYTTTQAAGECCARSPDGGTTIVCGQMPSLGSVNP